MAAPALIFCRRPCGGGPMIVRVFRINGARRRRLARKLAGLGFPHHAIARICGVPALAVPRLLDAPLWSAADALFICEAVL